MKGCRAAKHVKPGYRGVSIQAQRGTPAVPKAAQEATGMSLTSSVAGVLRDHGHEHVDEEVGERAEPVRVPAAPAWAHKDDPTSSLFEPRGVVGTGDVGGELTAVVEAI